MTKRIPSQSAFAGISRKQWVRFVNSLTEDEAGYLIQNSCNRCEVEDYMSQCDCNSLFATIYEKFHKYSYSFHCPIPPPTSPCSHSPPASRLVGIELNPGPRGPRKTVTTTTLVNPQQVARSNKQIQTVTRVRTQPSPQTSLTRPRNRVNNNSINPINNSSNSFLKQYVNTIQDPWEYGPMDLGYGTLIQTVKATSYVRNNFTVNADGSFGVALLPSNTNMVITNNSGATVATWVNASATNGSAVNAQMTSARIVSGGIRVFTLFPETSSSGVLFAGSMPGLPIVSFSALTPTTLSQASTSELGIGKRGARTVILPIDMSAFNMTTTTLAAPGSSQALSSTIPYISGLGFPTGTVVWYEAVLNLEGIPQTGSSGVGIDADHKEPTASDYFATPERLMRAASGLLTQTIVMDAVQGMTSLVSPQAGRLLSNARSYFGGGRNLTRSLVAGRNFNNQSRQTSVVIEEMKEEANPGSGRGWLRV